jgi:hypothetical protein
VRLGNLDEHDILCDIEKTYLIDPDIKTWSLSEPLTPLEEMKMDLSHPRQINSMHVMYTHPNPLTHTHTKG